MTSISRACVSSVNFPGYSRHTPDPTQPDLTRSDPRGSSGPLNSPANFNQKIVSSALSVLHCTYTYLIRITSNLTPIREDVLNSRKGMTMFRAKVDEPKQYQGLVGRPGVGPVRAGRPGPSDFHLEGRGPAHQCSSDGPRSGPAHQFSGVGTRPGPSHHNKIKSRPGPAHPTMHLVGRGPPPPCQLSSDGPRPGPVLSIFRGWVTARSRPSH